MPNRYDKSPAKRDYYRMSRGGIRIGGGGEENAFNSVMLKKPDGSWFDLSHHVNLTGNMGKLIPVMNMECYPGDRVKINNELLIRLQPMIAPAMQRLDAYVHSFFIPWRIIWEDFEKFLKGDAIAVPYLDLVGTTTVKGSLPDYMGVPPMFNDLNPVRVNALYFAAYQRTFFEYYRDQNLSAMTDNDKPWALNGNNATQIAMLLNLRNRAYNHDYFTSALPFTQKGTEATINFDFADVPVHANAGTLDPTGPFVAWDLTDPVIANAAMAAPVTPVGTIVATNPLFAKTSALSGTSFTVNDFRLALATQHWLERMAVGGTRLTEIIRAHFGVESSDARLDRPEYIGGMKTPIVISEVLQTSETADTPQGNMTGHGIAASYNDDEDSYFCEEHGCIISILSIMPVATYAQGLPKHMDWSARNDRNEWYWPQFANLGEQAIKVREVWSVNTTAEAQEETWGYTGRFNELRYIPSRIAGDFRDTLSHWSAARIFTEQPSLNEEFLTNVLADTAKMFAVTPTEELHELIINVLNKVTAFRLLPKYATPQLVG